MEQPVEEDERFAEAPLKVTNSIEQLGEIYKNVENRN